ncbi:MAG TPA: ATP-dependent protease, partial [Planctomycetota bacterium]|nr:ATP-dependent protease [Planctomycetota bacterium]
SVQAVGGLNEKIEGFFRVCKIRGLTGEQGVIIPRSNVTDLMLREEVVEAVRGGRFRIWAISSVDEGIELLTGRPAGERGTDGKYPPGSINALVEAKLREFAKRLAEFERL